MKKKQTRSVHAIRLSPAELTTLRKMLPPGDSLANWMRRTLLAAALKATNHKGEAQ